MQKSLFFWLLPLACLCLACTRIAEPLDALSLTETKNEIKALSDSAWSNHVWPQKDLDEGSKLLLLALSKAREIGDDYWQGDCLSQLSTVARLQEDLPLAMEYGKEALHHRTLLDSALLMGRSQNNIGIVFKNMGVYDSALLFFEKAIDNYQEADYPKGISGTKINIAETYKKQNLNKEALKAIWEVRLDWKKIKLTDSLDLYIALGNIHLDLGAIDSAGFYYKKILNRLLEAEKPDSSRLKKNYHNLSGWAIKQNLYEIAKGYALARQKLGNVNGVGSNGENLHHLGIIYTELNQYELAYRYLTEGETLFSANKDTANLAKLYHNMADLEKKRQNYSEAIKYLQNCLHLAKSRHDLVTEIEAQDALAEVYDKLEDYEASNKARFGIIQVKDSVFGLSRKALEFENLATKEKQLRIENERSELIIWFLSVAIIGGIIVVGLIFMQWRSRRKFNQLERDFFLAREDGRQAERSRIGKRLHDEVGALITVATKQLKSSFDGKALDLTLDQIASEVRNISNDLKSAVLTNLGLKDAIQDLVDKLADSAPPVVAAHFTILPEASLDAFYEVQAFAITKELLNNALKHAEAKSINIYLTVDAKHCEIMVEDNGKGIPSQMILNPTGQGIKSIQNRVKKLDASCEFDTHPKSGTNVTITIPIKLSK